MHPRTVRKICSNHSRHTTPHYCTISAKRPVFHTHQKTTNLFSRRALSLNPLCVIAAFNSQLPLPHPFSRISHSPAPPPPTPVFHFFPSAFSTCFIFQRQTVHSIPFRQLGLYIYQPACQLFLSPPYPILFHFQIPFSRAPVEIAHVRLSASLTLKSCFCNTSLYSHILIAIRFTSSSGTFVFAGIDSSLSSTSSEQKLSQFDFVLITLFNCCSFFVTSWCILEGRPFYTAVKLGDRKF